MGEEKAESKKITQEETELVQEKSSRYDHLKKVFNEQSKLPFR